MIRLWHKKKNWNNNKKIKKNYFCWLFHIIFLLVNVNITELRKIEYFFSGILCSAKIQTFSTENSNYIFDLNYCFWFKIMITLE